MSPRVLLPLLLGLAILAAAAFLPGSAESFDPSTHQCSYCHAVHTAPAPDLLKDLVTETLCLTCHGPAGTSTLKADVHTNATGSSYDPFRITCVECHESHSNMGNWLSGINIKLVGTEQDATGYARINTPNSGVREVVFESRGKDVDEPTLHSFADADEDGNGYYDGICETCHTVTRRHRNNDTGQHSHQTGATCTRCHLHSTNFNK